MKDEKIIFLNNFIFFSQYFQETTHSLNLNDLDDRIHANIKHLVIERHPAIIPLSKLGGSSEEQNKGYFSLPSIRSKLSSDKSNSILQAILGHD